MTDNLPATMQSTPEKREIALLRAIGLDKASPEMRELALAIADRYNLDPMLRHLVLIDGKPFITRDGLLWIAHRSGQFDGIKVSRPVRDEKFWRADATVWRKDMSHPVEFSGRFPAGAKNDEEMCVKVAESMALRRAFNVAAPTVDERWAGDESDVIMPRPSPALSLAEVARARAEAAQPAQDAPSDPEPVVVVSVPTMCGVQATDGLMAGAVCILPAHDSGPHKSSDGSWPR